MPKRSPLLLPGICGNLRLDHPGDTAAWHNSDDDNDGEYTGGYLAMESFRYAVTKSEDARQKARKAFDFLTLLQTVTGTEGFFARTIVPADWHIDHTLREDVQLVRSPILEDKQISELPPASMRATVRWDKNPWGAISGDPLLVREPVFWLWPYWMARHLEIIKN